MTLLYIVQATADGTPITLRVGVDAESRELADTMLDDYLENDAPGELAVQELVVDNIAVSIEPFTIIARSDKIVAERGAGLLEAPEYLK